MSSSEFDDDDDRHRPSRGQLVRGIAAAVACDAAISLPIAMLMPLVRPQNVAEAIGKLLLGLNMLVGYVGGRVAAKAGLSHEDSRSQWTMASVVSGVSIMMAEAIERLRVALHLVHVQSAAVATAQTTTPDRLALASFVLIVASMLLLIRFGYAMGTYAQAKREGRVHDEDEASVE